ncbi:PQQ-binding-like beta-propeller repeat protein [Halosegnis marinus]|uniref:PQQ-binding-like beta-propeller repeat protein n=1 Tax=Halosegnis marinus TaxID=3034023 RepID=UPI00360EE55F
MIGYSRPERPRCLLSTRRSAPSGGCSPSRQTNRLSAPAVAGDTVYVVGQHPEHPPTLWALARGDGTVRWRVELGGETAAPPIVDGGAVYCVTTNGGLYAVDIDDRTTTWTRSLSPVVGPPAVGASGVFVPLDDEVVAYGTDGSSRWRTPGVTGPRSAHDGLVASNGTVYGVRPDEQGLVALSTETGDEQWRVQQSTDTRSPIVVDETVYAQDTAGSIRALSTADGVEQWSTRGLPREATGITVTGGGLIVGGDGLLARYD